MLKAIGVKVAPRDEYNLRFFEGYCRSRVGTAVEDGYLGDRLAGDVHRQHLFPAVHGGLEEANLAPRNNMQSIAWLAFRKQQLACTE
jgi:hypothetical protein